MSDCSKINSSLRLSIIALVEGDIVDDFAAITLSLIGIGVVLTVSITGYSSCPLVHSWSVWGLGL